MPSGDNIIKTRRNLPHWQKAGSTYFVTFTSARGELPPEARDITIEALLHDHARRCWLHAALVMPDHCHCLVQPLESETKVFHDLNVIMRGIKGTSGRRIAALLGEPGRVWQAESHDRIVRNSREFFDTLTYIQANPVKADLCEKLEDFQWYVQHPNESWYWASMAEYS